MLTQKEWKCDKELLESYDLIGNEKLIKYRNLLCPTVRHNCCDYRSQLIIFRKWNFQKVEDRLKDIYGRFIGVFEEIFDNFGIIERVANDMLLTIKTTKRSYCKLMAQKIKVLSITQY